jgi:hypothetical protein
MLDALRPPPPLDPARGRYKDWLHLNVFDRDSGCVGLFNASLHGPPDDPRSRVLGTALVHHPALGWLGNVEVAGYTSARIGATGIALERVAVALAARTPRVQVSAILPADRVEAKLEAASTAPAIDVALPLPFGSGWISWRVIPAMTVSGSLTLGEVALVPEGMRAYHDHNWGRWRWGDDAGWEWGAFSEVAGDATLVLSRTTNRAHDHSGPLLLTLDAGNRRRAFNGPQVHVEYAGTFQGPLRRVPGALAALHADRARPHLPAHLHVTASDGSATVDLTFAPRAAAQLIAAEPLSRGYSFIHELVGSWSATCQLAGQRRTVQGLGVFEWVS